MKTIRTLIVTFALLVTTLGPASAQILPGEARAVVPVVGSTAGAFGANFRTELQLHNGGSEPMTGILVFRAAGQPGTIDDPSLSYELGAFETKHYADVVDQMGGSGLGSLDIIPDTGSKLPTAVFRAFDDKDGAGTTGVTVPMVLVTKALTSGKSAALIVPSDLVRFRFNIGVRSLREGVTLHVVLYNADGTVAADLGERSYPGNYFEQRPATEFLGVEPQPDQSVGITVVAGRAIVYGTTTDNKTNDGSIQLDEIFNTAPTVFDPAGDGSLLITATTSTGEPVTITAAVSDEDGDPIEYVVGSAAGHGSVGEIIETESGFTIVYTPEPGFLGEDEFTIIIGDGEDAVTLTIRIIVSEPGNTIPTAEDTTVTTAHGTPVDVTMTGADADGDSLTFSITTAPSNGTLSSVTMINSTSARVTYTPAASFSGVDHFEYSVNDGRGGVVRATVTVIVTPSANRTPVATDQTVSMAIDTPASFTLLASDPDGDTLTYSVDTTPANGTLSGTAPDLTFTPSSGFSGNDGFSWSVSDGRGGSDSAVVTLVVAAAGNTPPVADDLTANTDEDTPVSVTLVATDADGDTLSYSIASAPSYGTLSGTAPNLTYTPNPDFNGVEVFTWVASDGTTSSNTATVTVIVRPVNDAPVAAADAYGASEDTTLNVPAPGVLANDSDVDGDTLSASVSTSPASGTLTLSADGAFTYTPNADFNGTDSFTYTVSDGKGGTDTAVATITVTAVNDAPVASHASVATDEDTAVAVTIAATDADGDALNYKVGSSPSNGTLSGTAPNLTYVPHPDFNGADSFTFTASDGTATSNVATITITVNSVNDAPVADDLAVTTAEDTSVAVTLTGSDIDGDVLSYAVATPPTNGALSGTAPNFTYTPNANFNGTDSFTFTVNDGVVDSAAATVSITVTAVNDPPVAADESYTVDEGGALNVAAPGVLGNDLDIDGDPLAAALVSGVANGVLTLSGDGSFTYTHDGSETTSDSFTYTASDGAAFSNVATVAITVTPVNDAPVIDLDADDSEGTPGSDFAVTFTENDPATLLEDAADAVITDADHATLQSLTVTLTNVIDAGSELLDADVTAILAITKNYDTTTDPTIGVLTLTGPATIAELETVLRTVSYRNLSETPDETPRVITFVANDGTDAGTPATATVTITSVNDAPVASDQSVTTDEDTAVAVTLSSTDADGDALTYAIVSGPADGVLSGTAPNLTYTPNANYNGSDSFTFRVNDGTDDSNTATVSITVIAVNDPPIADVQSVTTDEDLAIAVTLTASDVEGSALTYTILSNPANGVLSGTAPNLTYTPNANYNGSDSFTFKVDDGTVDSNMATVSITVTSVNDAPVAGDQSVTTDEDAAVAVALVATDVEGSTLTYTIVSGPANGVLSGTAPNLTYTPNANDNGSDSFTFRVNDGTDDSNTATVSITVTAVNDPPVADAQSVTTDEDIPVAVTLAASDVEGSALTYTIVSNPANGVLSGTAPNLTYTPNANYNGSDGFTFKVDDGTDDSNTATVSITVTSVNDAPVASAQSVTTDEDVAAAIALVATDVEGSTLTYTIVSGPANGVLSGTAPNLTYTPNANYNGSDSFTFKVNDGTDDSNTATVSITVTAVNDPPVADAQSVTTDEDASVAVTLAASDVEGSALTYTIVSGPANGVLSGTAPNLTYAPSADYNGSDSFTFKANDGTDDSNTATVSITVTSVNDAPVASAQSVTTDEDTAVAVTLVATDADGDALTYTIVSGPANGVLSGTAPNLTYTPNANDNGSDSFTFKVNDGTEDSNTATVSITVTAVNDPPVADAQSVTTDEDVAAAVTLTASDVEGSALTYTVVSNPANGVLSGTAPNLTYTPGADYNGSDSFTFKANDGADDSNTATVSITITAVNDAPLADAQSVTTDEDTAFAVTLTATDADGDPITYTVLTNPTNGSLSGTAPNLTYTPAANYSGSDSFTFKANDGAIDSSAATVSITINPVNDAPVVADATREINENSANTTALGAALTFSDPDTGDSHTFSITAGNTGGAFAISNTGQITVANSAALDYETTPSFSLTVQVTDNGTPALSDTATVTVTVVDVNEAPVAGADSYSYIGNTELRIAGHTGNTSALAATTVATNLLANDSDPDTNPAFSNISITAVTNQTTANGSRYSITSTGTMVFTPGKGFTGSEVINYTLTDGTNNSTGAITFTRTGTDMVWYVQNNHATATPEGTSTHPHKVLATASGDSVANDIIYVMPGDGGTTGQNAGITLKSGQKLWGNGVALVVNGGTTLINAGSQPQIGNGAGDGVNITNISAEVKGLNIGGTGNAIDVTTTAGGTVTIANNTIRSAGVEGIDVNAAGGTLTLSISDVSIASTGSHGIDLTRTLGTLDVTALTNLNIAGTVGGAGVMGTGAMVVTGGGTWTIGSSIDRVSGAGVSLGNGASISGTISLTDLDVYSSGAALHVIGNGTGTTSVSTSAGLATLDASGGPAADLLNLNANLVLASIKSTGSTGLGFRLESVSGTVSAGSGSSISGAASQSFVVASGTANVTYAGTINSSTVQPVLIYSNSGGTIMLTGAITGTGLGVALTNNLGATITFSGGLTLSTSTSAAFTATGGGTVNVCDDNPCNPAATGGLVNTLTTTTGTALNVANTTIGANNLEFRSISSNGASSGVVLNTTGAVGGLKVKGTGGANSGGTIQSSTGPGISLSSTSGPSFSWMLITNNLGSGIDGANVTNFSLINSTVSNNADTATGTEAGLRFTQLLGNSAITNSTISGSSEDEVRITPSSGTLSNLAVSGSTFGPNNAATGGHGISIIATSTANVTLNVTNSTFQNIRSTAVLMNVADSSVGTANIGTSVFRDIGVAVTFGVSADADLTFDVTGNTEIVRSISNAIQLVAGSTSTTASEIRGKIRNNFIGDGSLDSGSRDMFGIGIDLRGDQRSFLQISGNNVRNTDQEAIWYVSADFGVLGGSAVAELTLTGNTVGKPDDNSAFPFGLMYPIRVEARHVTDVCADIRSNVMAAGVGTTDGMLLRQRNTAVFGIDGYGGAANSGAAVETYLEGINTGGVFVQTTATGTIVNYTNCDATLP